MDMSSMDMSDMTMTMASMSGMATSLASATAEAAGTATGTATSSAMAAATSQMSMSMGGTCKISMLWNWYTIDSCFISKTWHVTSKGMFAGSCIGVFFLVMALEFARRAHREYDRWIVRQWQETHASATACMNQAIVTDSKEVGRSSSSLEAPTYSKHLMNTILRPTPLRPTLFQQLIRALFYMFEFGGGYFVSMVVKKLDSSNLDHAFGHVLQW